jgi:hypothetical protein
VGSRHASGDRRRIAVQNAPQPASATSGIGWNAC